MSHKTLPETTPASAIKSALETVVETPSGWKFRIRKMDPFVFSQLSNILSERPSPDKATDFFLKHYDEIAKIVFPSCVIEPKIVASEAAENEVHYKDLAFDGVILLTKIFEHSGVTGVVAERTESFRDIGIR